jgi:hypothetical protein
MNLVVGVSAMWAKAFELGMISKLEIWRIAKVDEGLGLLLGSRVVGRLEYWLEGMIGEVMKQSRGSSSWRLLISHSPCR